MTGDIAIKEVHVVRDLEFAPVLLNPIRVELLGLLRRPATATELAAETEMTPQRVNNHLQEMLRAGLVRKVETRTRRNLIESVWQAVAKSYWLSPRLTRTAGEDVRAREQRLSLHNLLRMAEQLQEDAGTLLEQPAEEEVPSIGLTAEITLKGAAEREAFTKDLIAALHGVIQAYRPAADDTEGRFTAMVVCYPAVEPVTRAVPEVGPA